MFLCSRHCALLLTCPALAACVLLTMLLIRHDNVAAILTEPCLPSAWLPLCAAPQLRSTMRSVMRSKRTLQRTRQCALHCALQYTRQYTLQHNLQYCLRNPADSMQCSRHRLHSTPQRSLPWTLVLRGATVLHACAVNVYNKVVYTIYNTVHDADLITCAHA